STEGESVVAIPHILDRKGCRVAVRIWGPGNWRDPLARDGHTIVHEGGDLAGFEDIRLSTTNRSLWRQLPSLVEGGRTEGGCRKPGSDRGDAHVARGADGKNEHREKHRGDGRRVTENHTSLDGIGRLRLRHAACRSCQRDPVR